MQLTSVPSFYWLPTKNSNVFVLLANLTLPLNLYLHLHKRLYKMIQLKLIHFTYTGHSKRANTPNSSYFEQPKCS